MGLLNFSSHSDATLEAITVMVQAQGESGYGVHCKYDPKEELCRETDEKLSYCAFCD